MKGLEITVLLGLSVLVGAVLAPRLRVAAPLLLLACGLLLGFVPELRDIELPPETVLLLFLPVMLFWESLTSSLRSIKRDIRGIVLLSTLLVVVTAGAVAVVAHLMGLPWEAALILGAAVAPPDATAVAALGRMMPQRNFMLLKAESLTNDGTALVVYSMAVGIAVGGHYSPWDVTGLVLLSYLGGIAAGAAVAGLAYLVMRRMRESLTINIALLLVPFAAFLAAEAIGASGVLAVVVAGLVVSFASPHISTAASRRQTESVWPLGSYLLNGSLFVLVGLQVQAVARDIAAVEIGGLVLVIIAVWLTLLLVRFIFQTASIMLGRLIDPRAPHRQRRMGYRARIVSTAAGFRGAISLAIALSVPLVDEAGTPLAGRPEIVFVTAGVVVLTLLVQGPLLPVVVRWARLPADTAGEEELRLAQREITSAALSAIDEIAAERRISASVRDRIRRDNDEHLELTNALEEVEAARREDDSAEEPHGSTTGPAPDTDSSTGTDDPDARNGDDRSAATARHRQHTDLQLALLERKREVLLGLLRDGSVDDLVARELQARLDVEELRLTGADPID
ncbi:Na+/H+ antiporter [Micrococcaceae bacterium RIT802]|nr:Na+/H+ antiporter [Micrococcaceae bacterium RIT 802]